MSACGPVGPGRRRLRRLMGRGTRHARPIVLVHGGAGARKMTDEQALCLTHSLVLGYALLARGDSALAAVEAAIQLLEGSGLFNAGLGARTQLDGVRRMDASIMEGRRLRAGAVAGIEGIRHPITAARLVLEKSGHVLLAGEPATRFARHFGLAPQARRVADRSDRPRPARGVTRTRQLFRALQAPRGAVRRLRACGTVGAVALDARSTIAAGASTGGIGLMLPGRVGDSPLIGAGVYADNESGGISMTGMGESVIRLGAAKAMAERLAAGRSPDVVARTVLRALVARTGGRAGALVLGRDGRFAIRHVTTRMAAGYWDGEGEPVVRDKFL